MLKAFLEMLGDGVIHPDEESIYLRDRGLAFCDLSSNLPSGNKKVIFDKLMIKSEASPHAALYATWLSCFNPEG